MTALAQNRSTIQQSDRPIVSILDLPVAASTLIYQGAMVAVDKLGNLINVATPVQAGGVIVVGAAQKLADNSAGTAGAILCRVEQGLLKWVNSGTDPITAADIGQPCYASDNQTVTRTDSAGTRPYVGTVQSVDTDGVWVEMRLTQKNASKQCFQFAIDLASIPAGNAVAFKPGFGGRITRLEFSVAKPATTAAKLATLTPNIAGNPVTGGVLALTSANCTPSGANIAGSTVTAANQFGAQDTITVVGSAITAFVEGTGTLLIYTE